MKNLSSRNVRVNIKLCSLLSVKTFTRILSFLSLVFVNTFTEYLFWFLCWILEYTAKPVSQLQPWDTAFCKKKVMAEGH